MPSVVIGSNVSQIPPPADDPDKSRPRPLEELFLTEVVYPQEAKETQLTLSSFWQTAGEERGGAIQAGIEYGLTGRWELSVDWNAVVHRRPRHERHTTGVGDVEVGTKYVIHGAEGGPLMVALAFELGLPTGDPERGLGEGEMSYAPEFLLGWTWPELHGLTAFAEAGPEFVQRVRGDSSEESAAHAIVLAGGLVLPWRRFSASLEGRWTNNRWNHHGEENRIELGPGLHWRPTRDSQIGAGCIFGSERGERLLGFHFIFLREF